MELNEYQKGWRYLVWVGGVDDAFVHYQDALDSYNGWTRQGYDDVILSKLNNFKTFLDERSRKVLINSEFLLRVLYFAPYIVR